MVSMSRVIELKGAAHIWEVMITRDALFFDFLAYLPMLIGLVMGVVQFAPEVYHKSLKLTLHLPYSPKKLTMWMIGAGFSMLAVCFIVNWLFLNIFLNSFLAYELKWHVLNTSLVWFLAGLAAYFLAAWITLEPTWRTRVLNIVVSVLVLSIYFISSQGEAYNSFLPILSLYTLALSSLAWLSVKRFKEGKQ